MNNNKLTALSCILTALVFPATAADLLVSAKDNQVGGTSSAAKTSSLTLGTGGTGGTFDPDLPVAAPGNYLIHKTTVEDLSTGLEWQRGQKLHIGLSWMDAQAYCRDLLWGGAGDWRLPDVFELQTLVKYDQSPPGQTAIDVQAFPETKAGTDPNTTTTRDYWSSTTHWSSQYDEPHAVVLNFFGGEIYTRKTDENYAGTFVRCVRGGRGLGPVFRNNGDGTVTDIARSLIWQRDADENSASLSYCDTLALAGETDWRLPTVKELASLLDFRTHYNTAYTSMFPSTFYDPDLFWATSDVNVKNTNEYWTVVFTPGGNGSRDYSVVAASPSGASRFIRCVRTAD